ncbi:MAG: hypothetical protein AcusKO_13620 [Acuticoccus sp.]
MTAGSTPRIRAGIAAIAPSGRTIGLMPRNLRILTKPSSAGHIARVRPLMNAPKGLRVDS